MSHSIAVLPGDGIGPEVVDQAELVLDAVSSAFDVAFTLERADVGGIAIDNHGSALPESTLELCRAADAILFGSVGGPKWESLPPDEQPERAALLPLRKIFGLFANLRPAIVFPQLAHASPLKEEALGGSLDIVVVRELTGGIYFGSPKGREEGDDPRAFDTLVYHQSEIERIARVAFDTARARARTAPARTARVCSIDKANVLTSMVFWRETVSRIAREYDDVELTHMYVDNAAMQLVKNPSQFDVILAGNMFGDILSDEAAMLTGSLGMLPSASLALDKFGLYEPSGGSAPDIAGKGVANPIAQVLSAGMMLKYSFGLDAAYDSILAAVRGALDEGLRTADIAGAREQTVGTEAMGRAIAERIRPA